jgi:hypothetical protein
MKFLERKLNTHKNYTRKHIKENKEYRFTYTKKKKKLLNSKAIPSHNDKPRLTWRLYLYRKKETDLEKIMQSITMKIDLVLQNSLEREWHARVYMWLSTLNLTSEPKQTK